MKVNYKFRFSLLGIAVFLGCTVTAGTVEPAEGKTGFIENKGQFHDPEGHPVPQVLFRLAGTSKNLFVTKEGLTYIFTEKQVAAGKQSAWSKLEMQLAGASIRPENISCESPLPGYSNFYYPHCSGGILGVKTWEKVTIRSVYPGIDWVLHAAGDAVSHDFIVHPGADPAAIRLVYQGADRLAASEDKQKLEITCRYGTLFEGELNVWTEENNTPVAAQFQLSDNELHFKVSAYNRKATLLIDPPLLWASTQASSGLDNIFAVAAVNDGSGDVCVTGSTDGTDFPVLNPYQAMLGGNEDMVVQRLDGATGNRIWSTYYGAGNVEAGKGVATDTAGNCYVTGYTGSSNFPVLNPFQVSYGGGTFDATFMKLNAAGVRQWASWYGGSASEQGMAIVADNAGNTYITGYTGSSNFIALNAIQATKNFSNDAFVIKLNNAAALQFATFYGGDDDDKGRGITLQGSSLYITGSTLSGSFPNTSGGFQSSNANAYNAEDAFIVKMNTAGSTVSFASFWGGTDADFGQGIAVDTAGAIYITGYTLSGDIPLVNPGQGAYMDSTLGNIGMHDAFIAKCSSAGSNLNWSSYFGGGNSDLGMGISADPQQGVFVTGRSASTDFPLQQPADNLYYQATQGDGGSYNDFFLAWFYNSGELKWSTYYGGANDDEGYGISVNASRTIFAGGPGSLSGPGEAVVLKFGPGLITGTANAAGMQEQVRLFPDPASDQLNATFTLLSESAVTIRLTTVRGQLCSTTTLDGQAGLNSATVRVAELPAGVYLLEISSATGSVKRKFVKI